MSRTTSWAVFTLLGIAVWLGATVYVAATASDPSDATPILRTFALGGAVFMGLVLLTAAWQVRHSAIGVSERLYRRLAVHPVSPQAFRAAARGTRSTAYPMLILAGAATALLLAAIAAGEAGPYRELFAAMFVLVVVWAVYSVRALGRAFAGAGDLLAPLDLTITETPSVSSRGSGGGVFLVGSLTFSGRRHGRQVSISQRSGAAVTTVEGAFPRRSMTSVAAMAALTGEPSRCWRNVELRAGDHGIVVTRRGNGAGRWYLHDLLLAESHADAAS